MGFLCNFGRVLLMMVLLAFKPLSAQFPEKGAERNAETSYVGIYIFIAKTGQVQSLSFCMMIFVNGS